MILYCVPKLRLMGQKFSVREKMDISGLQVGEPLPRNLFHWESTEQVEGHRALATHCCATGHLPASLSLASVLIQACRNISESWHPGLSGQDPGPSAWPTCQHV